MTCWRCGRAGEHADFCSDGTPNDCTHCGGNPCRWWCLGERTGPSLNADMPPWTDHAAYQRERYRRIRQGKWVFA